MKLQLMLWNDKDNRYEDAYIHPDFGGITTHQYGRGEFKVKEIDSITIIGEDLVMVYAHPNLPKVEPTTVAKAPEVVEADVREGMSF